MDNNFNDQKINKDWEDIDNILRIRGLDGFSNTINRNMIIIDILDWHERKVKNRD